VNISKLLITIAAVDGTSKVISGITRGFGKTAAEVAKLWREGKKLEATMKSIGKAGGVAAMAFGTLAGVTGAHTAVSNLLNAQEGFNKIMVAGGKTREQMGPIKKELLAIAGETGRSVDEIVTAAYDKISQGMKETDVYATLRQEGLYATASFSKDMGNITKATQMMSRHMKMDTETAGGALAGMLEISKTAGEFSFEKFMEATGSGLMRDAGNIMKSQSGRGKEGAMQVAAAAQIASRTLGADDATAGIEGFFADLRKAKTEGSLEKIAGINMKDMIQRAEKSSDAIGTIVEELMAATKGDEIELSKIFKSDATRGFIKAIKDARPEFDAMWRKAQAATDAQAKADAVEAMKDVRKAWGRFQTQMTGAMDKEVAPWLERITRGLELITSDSTAAKIAVGALKFTLIGAVGFKGISKGISITQGAIGKVKALHKMITADPGKVKLYRAFDKAGVEVPKNMQHMTKRSTQILSNARVGIVKGASKTWGAVTKAASASWDGITKAARAAKDFASSAGAAIGKGMRIAGTALKAAGSASWGFVKSLWAQAAAWAMTPIGMITIAIAALVGGAILLYKNWDKVTAFFKKLWGWIKIAWGAIKGGFSIAWNWIKAWFMRPIVIVASVFGRIIGAIKAKINEFKEAGKNCIKAIWEGIKSFVSKPIDAVKNMVGKIRKFLPFSPAKEGPLRDIHRIRLVETIADGIKEAPLLSKVSGIMGKARGALGAALAAPLAVPAKAVKALAPAALGAIQAVAAPARPMPPIQIVINIDARGAAPGVEQNIEKAILKATPQIERQLQTIWERKARASNTQAGRRA